MATSTASDLPPTTPSGRTSDGEPSGHSAGQSTSGGLTVVSQGILRQTPSKKWADLVEAEQEVQQFDGNDSDEHLPCAIGNSNCCHCAQRTWDQTSSEDNEQLEIFLYSTPSATISNPNPLSRRALTADSPNYNPCATSGAVPSPVAACSFSSSNNPTTPYVHNSSPPGDAVTSPCTPCSSNRPIPRRAMNATPTLYYTPFSPPTTSPSYHRISPMAATATSREVKVSPPYYRPGPSRIACYTPPNENALPTANLSEFLLPVVANEQAVFAGYRAPLSARKLEYGDQWTHVSKELDRTESRKHVGTSADNGQMRSAAIHSFEAPAEFHKQSEYVDESEGLARTAGGESERTETEIRRWRKKGKNAQGASQLGVGETVFQSPSELSETTISSPVDEGVTTIPIEWPLCANQSAKRKGRNWWPSNLGHFTGGPSTGQHHEATLWLRTLGSSILINQWDFPTAFEMISSGLGGTALLWYKANKRRFMEHREGLAAGWLEFWTGFEATFVVKRDHVGKEELENRVQIEGETVEEYAASVKGIARRLGYHMDDALVRFQLINGILDPGTRAKLETLLPSSFQDILHRVDDYEAYDTLVKKKTKTTPTLSQCADLGAVDIPDVRPGPAGKQGQEQAESGSGAACKTVMRTGTGISNASGQASPQQQAAVPSEQKKPSEKQASVMDNQKGIARTGQQTKASSQGGDLVPEMNKAPQPVRSPQETTRGVPKSSTIPMQAAVLPAQDSLTASQESLVVSKARHPYWWQANANKRWAPKGESHKASGSAK